MVHCTKNGIAGSPNTTAEPDRCEQCAGAWNAVPFSWCRLLLIGNVRVRAKLHPRAPPHHHHRHRCACRRQVTTACHAACPARYIYMTQPWPASFYVNCGDNGVNDWRNKKGGMGPNILTCPNATAVADFKSAAKAGDIFFQAFPHNGQPGIYESSLFEASLKMSMRLADDLEIPRPRTFSQRDETGMTRAILPLLNKHNVSMISLGSGGSSGGHPVIPDLFVWKDTASGAKVLFAFDHGYGGGTHILPNGHALYCAWNTDNGGPQSPQSAESMLQKLRKRQVCWFARGPALALGSAEDPPFWFTGGLSLRPCCWCYHNDNPVLLHRAPADGQVSQRQGPCVDV